MTTKTYINTTEMQENISNFNKRITKIKEIFESVDKDINVTKDNGFWLGSTSDVIYKKYDELSASYDTIINSLNRLSGFMSSIAKAYETFDATTLEHVEDSDLDM